MLQTIVVHILETAGAVTRTDQHEGILGGGLAVRSVTTFRLAAPQFGGRTRLEVFARTVTDATDGLLLVFAQQHRLGPGFRLQPIARCVVLGLGLGLELGLYIASLHTARTHCTHDIALARDWCGRWLWVWWVVGVFHCHH